MWDFILFYSVGVERLEFKPEGYNFWTWRGHKIHYVVQGEGPPVVLIHGFGASAFHWRFATLCPSPSIFPFSFYESLHLLAYALAMAWLFANSYKLRGGENLN